MHFRIRNGCSTFARTLAFTRFLAICNSSTKFLYLTLRRVIHVAAPGNLAMLSIPPFDPAKPCPCGLHGKSYGDCCKDKGIHALGNEMLHGTAPRMVPGALSQIQSSMVKDDTRFRIVWNTVW